MSTIDDRLWQKPKTPKRPLRSDFTEAVMADIEQAKPAPLVTRIASAIRRPFAMRLITKPAGIAAGVAVLAITAGTGYATLRWLQPNTQVISAVTTLENGNKRFWLHSDACQGQNMDYPVDSYYEIKAGSAVTPEQIRAMVESGCEDDMLEQLFPDVIKPMPKGQAGQGFKPGDRQYSFPYAKLKAVGKDYIVVDSGLNGQTYKNVRLPLENDARIYAKGKEISKQDLRPGKWLTLVTYTTALDKPFATETMTPDQINELAENGFPRGTKVEGVIERQYDVEQTMSTMENMGMEWTRLVKDDKSPDGWKQLIPLDGDWSNYNR
ncbi:MAG TPA: hypothetical protein VFT16_04355 [Candidatus Saccharimonadales bacterium]|nr:hypothetical protein [Candidatus Saccharimonadales bacterium]